MASKKNTSTSLRAMTLPDDNGVRVLEHRELDYRDGAEETLLALLADADDITSTSDELAAKATTWAEQYHLDPSRANVLRSLDIPAGSRVLEIGAGCGAITRYLGEIGAHVDAVEPVPSRAAVARARCRDLPNVEVYLGRVENVPREADYDLVVVVGVLEYTGRGDSSTEPHRRFLDDVNARLKTGGSLVLAIENKLGVKYLAGAPEDHYNVPYEGVEGYPSGGTRARTFSRRELETMLTDVGLSPLTLAAFPDYKMTRTVMHTDALHTSGAGSLTTDLPIFPSPDWVGTRSPAANEKLLWRSLTQAGLPTDTANSLLVLASKGKARGELWPAERLARYYSWNRRAEYTLVSTVESDPDHAARIRRQALTPAAVATAAHSVIESTDAYVDGTGFIEAFTEADEPTAQKLIRDWAALLGDRAANGTLTFDCVPTNVRLRRDGSLTVIDEEWRSPQVDAGWVLRRGILRLALNYRGSSRRPAWVLPTVTPREIASTIGAWVRLDDPLWIDETVDAESALQAQIQRPTGRIPGDRAEHNRNELILALSSSTFGGVPPRSAPGTGPEAAEITRLVESVNELTALYASTDQQNRDNLEKLNRLTSVEAELRRRLSEATVENESLKGRLAGAAAELSRMRATLSWRVTGWLRAIRKGMRK